MLADTEIFLKLGLTEKPVEGVHIKYFYLLTYPNFFKNLPDTQIFLTLGLTEKPIEGVHIRHKTLKCTKHIQS